MRFKNLIVYQKAFALSMDIFQVTKSFPKDERFELTSQIRRSSRSVCSNLGEGYRKRKYPKHFTSKLTDADMENSETQVWLDFSLACEYISKEQYEEMSNRTEEIGKMLHHMTENPQKFS